MESVRRGQGVGGGGVEVESEVESSSEEEVESKRQRGRGLGSSLEEEGVSTRRFLLRWWGMDRGSLPSCSEWASENVSKERFSLP